MKNSLKFFALVLIILSSCTLPQKTTSTATNPIIASGVSSTTSTSTVLIGQASGTTTIKLPDTIPVSRSARLEDPTSRRKTTVPVGLQNETIATSNRTQARALVLPGGEVRYVLSNKDTIVIVTTAKNLSYTETDTVRRKYVPPVTPPANAAPIANAGPDKIITLPTNSTTIAGAGVDGDGTIASYLWSKVAGGAATISAPAAATTNVTGLVQGEYTFRLTVKDNGGLTGADDVKVTVNPAAPTSGYLNLPASGALDLSGRSGVVVEGKSFKNISGVGIKLYSGANNITIRNCYFENISGESVELENATNITIENCLFNNSVAGVYAVASKGVKVINCQFINMKIRRQNGQFAGRGVFVQSNACSDFQILNCKGENFAGESDAEDMISFFKSSNGIVRNNTFRGSATSTTSTSGGGIIIGDNGGDNITVENNTLMTPGQYGMAVAGGTKMTIKGNKIYSDRNAVSNNPLYVWAQAGASCGDVNVTQNRVYWIDKNGSRNNGWNAGNCSNTTFEAPTNITLSEMGVPDHLIDFVTPAELLKIRGK